MQPNPSFFTSTAVAFILTLSFAGCAAKDPVARAKVHPRFAALPAAQRQNALTGVVREGMSREGVFVAWGEPTAVYHGRAHGKTLEMWVYLRPMPSRPGPEFTNSSAAYDAARRDFLAAYYRGNRFDNQPGAVASRFYPGAIFYPGPVASSWERKRPILDRQAVFENGRVVRHARMAPTDERRRW